MRTLTINGNDAGQRLDKFLSKAVRLLPQSMMYRMIRQKKIKVNRHRAEPSQRLEAGDTVELFLAEEFFSDEPEMEFLTVSPSLDILYEDTNLLLCIKRPGMLCHAGDYGDETTGKPDRLYGSDIAGGSREDVDTLVNRIKSYLYQKGEYDPHAEQSFAPALCNRIDRNTGGIVIAAKTRRHCDL